MSSIERLKAKVSATLRTVNVRGEPLTVTALSARDGLAMHRMYQGVPKDESGKPNDDDSLLLFYVTLVSKCLVEPETMERSFDSDYGRELLESLGNDLFVIGDAAADINGMTVEAREEVKKN